MVHVGHPYVSPIVCCTLSISISFPDDNLSKYQCTIDIVEIWFGIANGHIYLPATQPYFPFQDDNLSKYQCIFTKLGMCIDIVEIWFGKANGQISSIFDRVIYPPYIRIFVSRQ